MNIAGNDIDAIRAFGYTEDEARFLYIVATHSGYFIPRQFLAFTGAKWGKRSTHFAEKIESHGHAAWREYQAWAVSTIFSPKASMGKLARKISAIAGGIQSSSCRPVLSSWISCLPTSSTTTWKPNRKRSTTSVNNWGYRGNISLPRHTSGVRVP